MDMLRAGEDGGQSDGQDVRVFVCAPPEESRLFVTSLPPGNPRGIAVVSFGDDASTLEHDVEQLGVTVVIISPHVRNYSDSLVARLSRQARTVIVVGLVPPTGDWARQLTTAGAIGVLRTPVSDRTIDIFVSSVPSWLTEAMQRRSEPGWFVGLPPDVAQAVSAMGFRRGVWGVWSPKGGVGKTTLACNVAALLGIVGSCKTLLLDLNMVGGHVDLHMGISTEHTVASLAHLYYTRGNLEPQQLQGHVIPWRAGAALDVLPGIQRVEQAGEDPLRGDQGGAFTRELLEVARRLYDFVVVDIGSGVNNSVHRTALTSADGVLVVATPDRAALVDIRNTLTMLEKVIGVERSRYTLVVNMWSPTAGLKRGEIISFLGLPEGGLVPIEPRGLFPLAVNEGEPFVLMNLGAKDPQTQGVVDAMAGIVTNIYPPMGMIWKHRRRGGDKALSPGARLRNILFG